jgi:hypothetical protein
MSTTFVPEGQGDGSGSTELAEVLATFVQSLRDEVRQAPLGDEDLDRLIRVSTRWIKTLD